MHEKIAPPEKGAVLKGGGGQASCRRSSSGASFSKYFRPVMSAAVTSGFGGRPRRGASGESDSGAAWLVAVIEEVDDGTLRKESGEESGKGSIVFGPVIAYRVAAGQTGGKPGVRWDCHARIEMSPVATNRNVLMINSQRGTIHGEIGDE